MRKTGKPAAHSPQQVPQVAKPAYFFFAAFNFAHLARCAAAILFLPAADIVRLAGAELVVLPADIDCERPRTLAHRARCARAILRLETEDTIRVGRLDWRDTPVPFKDSITEKLNWRTQPRSLNNWDHGEVVEVFDSKPGEVVASPPISWKAHQKRIA